MVRRHLAALTLVLSAPLVAQAGDAKDPAGTVQAPPPAEWTRPAPPRSPDEELATFTIADGYRVELVAAEPLVEDPVAIQFDAAGRMWVVEMRAFMADADGAGERDEVCRVSILTDADHDGRMDRKIVYAGGLGLARAVLPLGDGEALVIAAPRLWHCFDDDGDLVADRRVPIGDEFPNGFDDPEHAVNSPRFGLDNWIHFARFDREARLVDGAWQWRPSAFGGQWGLSMDDSGRFFFNTNSTHLQAHLVPGRYGPRHPHLDSPAFANQRISVDETVWPGAPTPGVNRGYQPATLHRDGELAGRLTQFTAACGPLVYRGDALPELRGDVFVAEPSANLVRRDSLQQDGTGLTARNAHADERSEFLGSTDERFRPVDLHNGPDGALYVVDMYRGIIQHRKYMTSYLRQQVDERDLATPIHHGRIWRVVPDAWPVGRGPLVDLEAADPAALVTALSSANGWTRDTAQRELVRRGGLTALPALRALARGDGPPAPRLHALGALDGLGGLDAATLFRALRAADAMVRESAVRLAEPRVADGRHRILVGVLLRMAGLETDPRVVLQLGLTLGAAAAADRAAVEAVLADLLAVHAADPRIRDAVISGLAGAEVRFLQVLASRPGWEQESKLRIDAVRRVAASGFRSRDPSTLLGLLTLGARERAVWRRHALLRGIDDALPKKGTRRIELRGDPALVDDIDRAVGNDRIAEVVARIREAVVFGVLGAARPLDEAERARFAAGGLLYATHCAACHQTDGQGTAGLAPPLRGSAWVLGSPERLAKVVLHGLTGPIEGQVLGSATMPDHGRMSDDELAAVLTYLRRGWDHEADPIGPELVGAVRVAAGGRSQPWSRSDLEDG